MEAQSIRVPENRIRENYQTALGLLKRAKAPAPTGARPAHFGAARFLNPVAGAPAPLPNEASGDDLEAVLRGDGNDPLLSPERHALLVEARRAVAVGMTIGEMVVEPLGFIDLGTRNRTGTLHGADLDRFRGLVRVKALVSIFAAAAHLSAMRPSAAGDAKTTGEIPLSSTNHSLLWFAAALVEAVRNVSDSDLDAAVARVCVDVMDQIDTEAHGAMGEHGPSFAASSYAVEADAFHIRGFSRPGGKRKTTVALQFKKPADVVGNHIAKAQALRLAKMMACHDFEVGKNPFVELGGFVFTFIGDGNPGTGKTTLIQMTAGLLKDYCEVGGYGFHFENFGVDQISEYQGTSGQNAKAFVDRVLDQRALGFGTIDDVDQVAGKRDDQRSSGGQQEVTAVLMDAFAGANTVVRGNCVFGLFSNYPEKVDPALRQRAGARWLVDGPQSREDYVDILTLLLGKGHTLPLGNHDLFAAQQIQKMVAESYESFSVPTDEKLAAVWRSHVSKHGEPTTLAGIGTYLHSIKEMDPRFTGRAVKNITDAIKFRAMDFELPDEWFATPEAFMRLPYDRKVAMISELRKPITVAMTLQEINRYAESELRYADKSDEAAIDGMVRNMRNQQAAMNRFGADEKERAA